MQKALILPCRLRLSMESCSDNMEMKISIPLDDDGFIEMECDYCKNRFMLHQSIYADEANLHFFCPVCGLPNSINTFIVPKY